MKTNRERKIAIIGLGYVGLPLPVEFAKIHSVNGFDLKSRRIKLAPALASLTSLLLFGLFKHGFCQAWCWSAVGVAFWLRRKMAF
jgi:hypothetical protein